MRGGKKKAEIHGALSGEIRKNLRLIKGDNQDSVAQGRPPRE